MIHVSDYYSVLRNEIAPLLPIHFETVLDIGCGRGSTLNWIRHKYAGSRVIGVEIDPVVAETAQETIEEILCLDIETNLAELAQYHGKIDVLLLLDVLEHLRDPWSSIMRLRKLLSPSGIVIASVPNVRNLKVILPLVFSGHWKYQDAGILDRTHLRFFTKSSVLELFERSGYVVQSVHFTGPLSFSSIRSAAGFAAYLLNFVTPGALRDFTTHQFLISARPVRSG